MHSFRFTFGSGLFLRPLALLLTLSNCIRCGLEGRLLVFVFGIEERICPWGIDGTDSFAWSRERWDRGCGGLDWLSELVDWLWMDEESWSDTSRFTRWPEFLTRPKFDTVLYSFFLLSTPFNNRLGLLGRWIYGELGDGFVGGTSARENKFVKLSDNLSTCKQLLSKIKLWNLQKPKFRFPSSFRTD